MASPGPERDEQLVRVSQLSSHERSIVCPDVEGADDSRATLPFKMRKLNSWRACSPLYSDRQLVEAMELGALFGNLEELLEKVMRRFAELDEAGRLFEALSDTDGLGALRELPDDPKCFILSKHERLLVAYEVSDPYAPGFVLSQCWTRP